ncbi:DNA cytosine methyltransferase [Flavobacterium sp. PS2]|uniref:DNA cytosine methyltransferase n=1 Tax=Flavobacterium sp. PS2 TaxID=3384157 RepID=UPI00390C452A
MSELTHIELFAGCGGMSLGLETAGFDLLFANELSPMAGETFAYNILGENLERKSELGEKANNTLWIKSNYAQDNLKDRLRENPFETAKGKYSDLDAKTDLNGKLLIGNIDYFLEFLNKNNKIVNQLKKKNVDLISGGPPCQSFSLAGKREKNNEKNQLPLSFSKLAGLIQPKIVLLENVKGITAPFTENGEKYYAWLEVCKAFVLEGFVPVCMMLNSKYFGVPQNRPRFILMAYRKDIFNKILKKNNKNEILKNSDKFYKIVSENINSLEKITIKDFNYYDIESNPELFDGLVLPKMTYSLDDFISTSEAIGDILRADIQYDINKTAGKYATSLNNIFSKNTLEDFSKIKNHEPRNHNPIIRSRFRFYQVIEQFQNGLKKGATDLFSGKKVSPDVLAKLNVEFSQHKLLFIKDKGEISKYPRNLEEVEVLMKSIPTKKHSQRALKEFGPAPAQLTVPDDLCHYHSEQPRTLTVREMARFQSFPDWFEFRSKVTTGGKMRKFQVPQYTQVGNAVPPLLAKSLGEVLKKQLKLIE